MFKETCNLYGIVEFMKTEQAILQIFEWKLLIPTPSEILKKLLYIANPD